MDDFVKSVPSAEQGIEIYKSLPAMLSKGGFPLTRWISNCEKTMTSTDQADKSPTSSKTVEDKPTSPSTWGLQWNVDAGETGEDNAESGAYTIRMRLLLKTIWKENGQSWDKELKEGN